MKKKIFLFGVWSIFILFLLYAGMRLEQSSKAEPAVVYDTVRTIAVVNMDQGIELNQEMVNYGTQLIGFMNDHFYITGLEEARTGVKEARFAAYVIIPVTFSEQVWSINKNPQKAILEYAVNPDLREDIVPEVIYDLKSFEMRLNADVSYLYLHSILEEFHAGQDSAEVIMENDREDMESLSSIVPKDLIQPLDFVELQPQGEYPEEIDLGDNYNIMSDSIDELGYLYDTYIDMAELDLEKLIADREPVIQALDQMNAAVYSINLLEDENGTPVYTEGKERLKIILEDYGQTIDGEREVLSSAFRWMARHDNVDEPAPEDEVRNTWLDEINEEEKLKGEKHNRSLQEWKDSFDYTKLATPSDATPSDATPSDATPSDATPSDATPSDATPSDATPSDATPSDATPSDADWLTDRDMRVVQASVKGIYGNIEMDLDELILDDESLAEVKQIIWQNFMDEEAMRVEVASASTANPVAGSAEAETYISGFFESMPSYAGGMAEKISEISVEIMDFCQKQIDYILDCQEAPVRELESTFDQYVVGNIQMQEDYSQQVLNRELDYFGDVFEAYRREMEEYDPFKSIDDSEWDFTRSLLRDSTYEIENDVNDKSLLDRDLIYSIEEIKDKDVSALQDSLNVSFEKTTKNVTDTLEAAKKNRQQVNQGNELLLHGFSKKLSYTRNGSVAATNVYDFIINPVTVEEKKLVGRTSPVNAQAIRWNSEISIIILGIAVSALWIQNTRLKKKNKREFKEPST